MAVARYYDHDRGEWVLLAAGRDGASGASSWDDLTGKPATFPPTIGTTATTAAAGNHTHSQYATTTTVNGVSSRVTTLENAQPIIVSSLPASPLPGRIYLVTG